MEVEVNKIILMEAIENLMNFHGIYQTTHFGISGKGTIVDYIILDDYGEIKFLSGDNPLSLLGEWEELKLSTEDFNRVLKEFNELKTLWK